MEHRSLEQEESEALLRLMRHAEAVRTADDFERWCRSDLRCFLPFGMLLCALGRLTGDVLAIDSLQSVNYPESLLHRLRPCMPLAQRHVLRRWLDTREPQFVDHSNCLPGLSAMEREEYEQYELMNIAAHGVIDIRRIYVFHLSLSQVLEPVSLTLRVKMRLIAPVLHRVCCQMAWEERLQQGTKGE